MGDKRYRVGGTRGGQDQFKWEDVKSDAHRENYLGHSLLAPVGRWQKGKDLKWWNKKRDGEADAARAQAEMEKARLKQLDEDLLNEALGLAPRKVRAQQGELSAADKKQLLEKGAGVDEGGVETERISGLGAGPTKHHDHIPTLTLKERELERLKRERERKEGGLADASLVKIVDYDKEQREKAEAGNGNKAEVGGIRKRSRDEKRAKKREKKDKKREKKKVKKREKKRLKQAKEDGQHRAGRVAAEGTESREARRSMDLPPNGSRGRDSSTTYRRSDTREAVDLRGKERITHRGYDRYGERHVSQEGVVPDGGRRRAEERGSFSSNRRRSRSPLERKEGRRERRDSRDRNDRRHPEVRRGLGDSRSARGRGREETMQERRASARNRSESSSSSSSRSRSSSSRSDSDGGDSSGSDGSNMASKARGRNRSASMTRRGTHESGRDKRGGARGAHHGRTRSRSAERRIERNGGREGSTWYYDRHFDGRRRDREGRRDRGDRDGRQY